MAIEMKITSKFGTEHPKGYIKVLGARTDNTNKKVNARVGIYIDKAAHDAGMTPIDSTVLNFPLELKTKAGENIIKQAYDALMGMEEYKGAKKV